MRCASVLTTLALWMLPLCGSARAEVLFGPQDDAGARRSAAVPRVRTLALRAPDLASLRDRQTATITEFPLGVDGTANLDLEHFEPLAAGAHADVVEAGGSRAIPLPDDVYFRGHIHGDRDSRVLLIAAPDHVRGWVATAGTVYRIGIDADRVHRSYALRDVPADTVPTPAEFCGYHGQAELAPVERATPRASGPAPAAPPTAAFSPQLIAQVAIDTDEELRAKFPSDSATLSYVIDLVAAASTIYQNDVDVQLIASYVRIWNTTDPWSSTSTSGALSEVRNYWTASSNDMNTIAGPRDLVHFVSGKFVHGGVAYIDVLCNASYGYAVSQVYGSFDVMDPSETWDVVVFSHETGHIFGSPHTHCYSPPLDHCYNGESGCYSGPEQPSTGTIMSYCHLSGGMSAIQLTFGSTVSDLIRSYADASSCVLAITCGDGVLSSGEECDDGNTAAGDCCSPTCTFEASGTACDDANVCTNSDQCNGTGVCGGTAVTNGSACDDGSLCTSDSCQAGVCVGAGTPATSCHLPVVTQGAQLLVKNKTGTNGDTLSWRWLHGAATTLAELGTPSEDTNYELCLYDGDGVWLNARIPAGGNCGTRPCWSASSRGYKYRDGDRTPDGINTLVLTPGDAGRASIKVKGKGATLGLTALSGFNLPVQVQLRTATACWGSTFSNATTQTSDTLKAKSD